MQHYFTVLSLTVTAAAAISDGDLIGYDDRPITAADTPVKGIAMHPAAAGDRVAILAIGAFACRARGAIAAGQLVISAATGGVIAAPAGAVNPAGRALHAAAIGGMVLMKLSGSGGGDSAVIEQPPVPTATAPAKVTGLAYAAPELTWAAPADGGSAITRYDIEIVAAAAAFTGTATATSMTTALDVSSQPSGDWKAQVRAVNAVGNGPWSDPASFTKAAAPSHTFDPNLYDVVWRKGDPGVTTAAVSGTEVSPTGFKVTQLDPQGKVQVVFGEGSPSKVNVVYQRADGALVGGTTSATGRFLQVTAGNGFDRPVTGGMIVVADVEESSNVTQTNRLAVTATSKITINGNGGGIRYNLGTETGVGIKDLTGSLQAGARGVWYAEFDVEAGTYALRNPNTGEITSGPLAVTTLTNATAVSLMSSFVGGALHGFGVASWASGEARPLLMNEVLADFPSAP